MSTGVEIWALALLLGASGCDHTEPFSYTAPAARGPFSDAIPRQLTFNPGDDRFPSVQSGLVAYSRRLSDRKDHDWCVSVLPDTGGQLIHDLCPPGPADTLVDAWRFPALSPDTASVIFWKERGLISNLVPATRGFVRVTWSQPDSVRPILDAPYHFADGTLGNAVRQVTWPSANTLRFVAGVEYVDLFSSDTVFTSLGVTDLDLTSGALALWPGTAGATSYANSADGGIWYASGPTVQHLAPGSSTPNTIATFPHAVESLADASGVPVAIIFLVTETGASVPVLGFIQPGETVFRQMWDGAAPLAVTADASSGTVVASVLRTGSGGLGGNLWMVR